MRQTLILLGLNLEKQPTLLQVQEASSAKTRIAEEANQVPRTYYLISSIKH